MRESRERHLPRRCVWEWTSSRRAFAGVLLALVTAVAPAATPVQGKLRVGGKPLTLRHAWVVRGPDSLDKSALRTYVVMTTEDVSADISKCPNLDCALFDSVKSGLVLGLFPAGYWLGPSGDPRGETVLRPFPVVLRLEAHGPRARPGRREAPLRIRADRLRSRGRRIPAEGISPREADPGPLEPLQAIVASSPRYSTNDRVAPSNPWIFAFVDSIT